MATEYLIYLVIILIGFVLGLTRMANNPIKPIIILLGVTLASEIVSRILVHNIHNSNPPYHFLNPLQSMLWGIFFWQQFNSSVKKKITLIACALLVILSIINSIFFQSLYVLPDNILRIQSFLFITLAFLLFFQIMDEHSEVNIFKDPVFLVTVALLWFSIISFIFINFHRYLAAKVVSYSTLRIVNYVSNYVYYLTLLIAVVMSRKSMHYDTE